MIKKQFTTDLLSQALEVQAGWVKIDEGLTFGPLNMGAVMMDMNGLRNTEHSLAILETQLSEMRSKRDTLAQSTWDKIKRVRAGVKANYGDDRQAAEDNQEEFFGIIRLA